MLICNTELLTAARPGEHVDVRITDGTVTEIKSDLLPEADEPVIDAEGGVLLPGLHDHHLHLRSLAAALASVPCGPPQVRDAQELAQRLISVIADPERSESDWIRGVGYHESVAGDIDRHWLDRHTGNHAVRIQHRSGRLWILNTRALVLLGVKDTGTDDPLERVGGLLTGRLYDADVWLRNRLGNRRQNLNAVSRWLASFGVTGLTETTPSNGRDELLYFQQARRRGELLQDMLVMGNASLDEAYPQVINGVAAGPHKFHLHDAALPELGEVCAAIEASHRFKRPVAFHCVTRAELVFTLVALREAGSLTGDRIEHASITPPDLLSQIATLGLTVVTQPNFVSERGDAYLRDVADEDQPWLYRLRGFLDAGIPLAGSTDAPFGNANPWQSVQAAVSRRTIEGDVVNATESLSPEEALELFLSPLGAPGRTLRSVAPGQPADLCLLDSPWSHARENLAKVRVCLTLKAGKVIWPDPEQGFTEDPE